MDSISGPSLGYGFFDTPFKLLILGDYHSVGEDHSTSEHNCLFSFLQKASHKKGGVFAQQGFFPGVASQRRSS